MAVSSWGYPPEDAVGTTTIVVPSDMVDLIAQVMENPDAFLGNGSGIRMIEVDAGTWVDIARIGAVVKAGAGGMSRIYITGLDGHFLVAGDPAAVFQRITDALSSVVPPV